MIAHSSDHEPKRKLAKANDEESLVAIIVSNATKQQDEGANREGIAGDKPAQCSWFCYIEMTPDDMDKIQSLAQRYLDLDLSDGRDSDEEDLAGWRVEWIGILLIHLCAIFFRRRLSV